MEVEVGVQANRARRTLKSSPTDKTSIAYFYLLVKYVFKSFLCRALEDMLAGHQQEIQAERDRKLDTARELRKNRRQRAT